MNREQITNLAREAGLFVPPSGIPEDGALMRFAAAVMALEQDNPSGRSSKDADRAALVESNDPVAYDGWVLREVLFDNGEPVGHREPTQEPVLIVEKEPDYWSGGHFHQGSKPHIDTTKVWSLPIGTKLYTSPPQRKPLTDEEIDKAIVQERDDLLDHVYEYGTMAGGVLKRVRRLARAIERAHGIGGQDD